MGGGFKVKYRIRIMSLFVLVAIMILQITGCINRGMYQYQDDSLNPPKESEYDICIYNYKSDIYDKFIDLCSLYEAETGVKIKVMPLDYCSTIDDISACFKEQGNVDIIPVRNIDELLYYKKHNMLLDLNNVGDEAFNKLIDSIDKKYKLIKDDKSNYLVPFSICGYGYMVDKKMLSDLFYGSDIDELINDLKCSSYNEFENLVRGVNNYIKNNVSSDIILNGNRYSIYPVKREICRSLVDVFSLCGCDTYNYGELMSSVALDAVFANPDEAYSANDSKIDMLKNPLIAYAKVLDLESSYTALENSSLRRGQDYINGDINGYDKALGTFLSGRSLFFRSDNGLNIKMSSINPDVYERLAFVPIKLPIKNEDIKVSGLTSQDINDSIMTYISVYYAINSSSSDLNKKLAKDFLLWLSTKSEAKDYLINELKVIPYDYKEAEFKANSLNSSVLSYIDSGRSLSNAFCGTPSLWGCKAFGEYIKENYLIKPDLTNKDYNEISQYGVNKYKQLKNK